MGIREIEENKGKFTYHFAEYIGDVIAENIQEQKMERKCREGGFGRKIASIPSTVFRAWQKEFEQMGGKQQDKWVADWGAFLKRKIDKHPEFRTVDKLLHVTPNAGNTIIK